MDNYKNLMQIKQSMTARFGNMMSISG